jgi:hypothetical protein
MDNELVRSNNSLADLINWSKNGYIIILNKKSYCQIFARQEYKLSNKAVQINLSRNWECLMDEGEWPSYLIEYGCEKINKDDFLKLNLSNTIQFSM